MKLLERIARALLGRCGFQVGVRRLGRCGSCHLSVWEDDKRVRVGAEWFHADCAAYRRRAA